MASFKSSKLISSFVCLFIISSFIPLTSSFIQRPNLKLYSSKGDKEYKDIDIITTIDGTLLVGSKIKVTAELKGQLDNTTIDIQLVCKGDKCNKILGAEKFETYSCTNQSNKAEWNLTLKDNGLVTISVEVKNLDELDDNIRIDDTHTLKDLKVGKSNALNIAAKVVGYIYFVAWMISLYPLLILNFNRKSVVGLNIDFVVLNTTGYMAYAVYNVCLAFISEFREAYYEKFQGSAIPVELNDVLFACHGVVINLLICVQCVFYERAGQTITTTAKNILIAIYSPAAILTVLYFFDGVNKYYYISFFSYVKLSLTLCKYVPQAYFNYKRKSTKGWSVYYCLLDFVGGSFSTLQMLLNSINQDDYRNFSGNIGKVGLGLITISFDILFMIQHFILYRQRDHPILQASQSQSNYGSDPTKQFPLKGSLGSIQNDDLNNLTLNNDKRRPSNDSRGIRNSGFEG